MDADVLGKMSKDKKFSGGQEPLIVSDRIDTQYDFVASFTVANVTTDYDLDAQQSAAFSNVPKAWLAIIWTDQDISVKLNSTANPAISIGLGESPFELRNIIAVTNIYITNNSGSTANIKAMLV